MWAEYSNDHTYAQQYKEKSIQYLDSLLTIMPEETAQHDYRGAEKFLRTWDFENAEKMYLKALGNTPENTRLYAQMAYALALAYKETGDERRFRDWLNRFLTVLKLKVKQLSDLNSVADRYVRPSEAEIREMFFSFDTAFLKLYPDFIARFNRLLLPDKQIYPKDKELLNTDLRIYSLIRMGITDSNRIASLLFYSPQTIFNHRTAVRNRAINRATFERDVMEICTLQSPAE